MKPLHPKNTVVMISSLNSLFSSFLVGEQVLHVCSYQFRCTKINLCLSQMSLKIQLIFILFGLYFTVFQLVTFAFSNTPYLCASSKINSYIDIYFLNFDGMTYILASKNEFHFQKKSVLEMIWLNPCIVILVEGTA